MTYEEAIYCLTVMRNEVLDTWEFDFSNEETDALGLALEAMELQVAKKIKKIAPDVILLHNLHGYYLHVGVLFRFLKRYGNPDMDRIAPYL